MSDVPLTVHVEPFDELDVRDLYAIVRLRVDVFVVEQACAFGDLDGRDLEPTARHLWFEHDGDVVAYARILDGDGATEIGRIVTRGDHRSTGLGRRLMAEAMARIDGPMYLKAQTRVSGFYASFGFSVAGEEFLEDDIPHVPMRHPGGVVGP